MLKGWGDSLQPFLFVRARSSSRPEGLRAYGQA